MSTVDPTDLSDAMREALLFLGGHHTKPRARRSLLKASTVGALERRRLIKWEHTEGRTGWKLTDKGSYFVAWFQAQPGAKQG